MPLTTAPPTSGPIATPRPLTPPQTPNAMPRRAGGTASESNVSVSGRTMAAPKPCTARAAISTSMLVDRAAAALATVNVASPMENIRRRPKRSPRAAPVRSSTANVSVYALTVHSSDWIDAPRLRRTEGSAVVTTRLSSVVMNRPRDTIASVHARLGLDLGVRCRNLETRVIGYSFVCDWSFTCQRLEKRV